MLVYNITTKATHAIAEEWLHWIRGEYIPAMIDTGCFTRAVILHLLEADDEEGKTYAVQYYANSSQQYAVYKQLHEQFMRKKSTDRWGNKIISFHTLMQVVN